MHQNGTMPKQQSERLKQQMIPHSGVSHSIKSFMLRMPLLWKGYRWLHKTIGIFTTISYT